MADMWLASDSGGAAMSDKVTKAFNELLSHFGIGYRQLPEAGRLLSAIRALEAELKRERTEPCGCIANGEACPRHRTKLEAENARFKEALELIRVDVNEIDRMRTRAEKAEAERDALKAEMKLNDAMWKQSVKDAADWKSEAERLRTQHEHHHVCERCGAAVDDGLCMSCGQEPIRCHCLHANWQCLCPCHQGGGRESGRAGDTRPKLQKGTPVAAAAYPAPKI